MLAYIKRNKRFIIYIKKLKEKMENTKKVIREIKCLNTSGSSVGYKFVLCGKKRKGVFNT